MTTVTAPAASGEVVHQTVPRRKALALIVAVMVDNDLPEIKAVEFGDNGWIHIRLHDVLAQRGWARHFAAGISETLSTGGTYVMWRSVLAWHGYWVEISAGAAIGSAWIPVATVRRAA